MSTIEDETDSIVAMLVQIIQGAGAMHLVAIGEKQSGEDPEDALERLDPNPRPADVVIVDGKAYIYDDPDAVWLPLGGGAGDLNGFSLSLGEDGAVQLTYTNPEDETDTTTVTAVTNTTARSIADALGELAEIWKEACDA